MEEKISRKRFLKYGIVIATSLALLPLLFSQFVASILMALICYGSLVAVVCVAWLEEDSAGVEKKTGSMME